MCGRPENYFAGVSGALGAAGSAFGAGAALSVVGAALSAAGAACCAAPNPCVFTGLVVCVSVAAFSSTLCVDDAVGAT